MKKWMLVMLLVLGFGGVVVVTCSGDPISDVSETCIDCHAIYSPGFVED